MSLCHYVIYLCILLKLISCLIDLILCVLDFQNCSRTWRKYTNFGYKCTREMCQL